MELTPLKDLPFPKAHKMLGDISVPAMGAIALAMVAVQFWRGRADGLSSVVIALGIVAIGTGYYSFRRTLGQLGVTISEKILSQLLVSAYLMAVFGFLTCIEALGVWPHH